MREIYDIIAGLIRKFPHLFGHIDLEKIYIKEIESERAPAAALYGAASKKIQELFEINDAEIRYIIEINECEWSNCTIVQQQWLMLDILASIGDDCDGRINKPPINTWPFIIDALCKLHLNSGYMSDPLLPNLIETDTEIW